MAGELDVYVARRYLKIALPGRKIGDVAPGDVLNQPEKWAQFRTLLKLGHIERIAGDKVADPLRCGDCNRVFKNVSGLKTHRMRKH